MTGIQWIRNHEKQSVVCVPVRLSLPSKQIPPNTETDPFRESAEQLIVATVPEEYHVPLPGLVVGDRIVLPDRKQVLGELVCDHPLKAERKRPVRFDLAGCPVGDARGFEIVKEIRVGEKVRPADRNIVPRIEDDAYGPGV
jgi:hypothetical protein